MYKVGDWVRIKNNLQIGEVYGNLTLYHDMITYGNNIFVIREVTGKSDYMLEGNRFCYSFEMLEPVNKGNNIYKVGTKLKIIDAGDGAHGCDNCKGIVTNEKRNSGISVNSDGFNILITEKNNYYSELGEIWRVSADGTYEIIEGDIMTKKDLKTGMTVRLRNGNLYKILKDVTTLTHGYQEIILISQTCGFVAGANYLLNLIFNKGKMSEFDIMEIFDILSIGNILAFDTSRLLWKREEPKKMTVAEAQVLLNTLLTEKVEIVSE